MVSCAVSMLLTAAAWCASASALAVPETVTATVLANGSSATTDWTTESVASAAAGATESPPTIVVYNSTSGEDDSRDSRFLSFTMGSDQAAGTATNSLLQEKQDDPTTDPSAHLVDIYTDCLMQLSFPCVQRKLLLFLDKLGRMKGFSVLGDLLSVVRIKRDMRPPLNETDLMARLNTVDEQSALSALMVHTLDRFIGSHILRVTLPSGITAALKGNARSIAGNTLDINLSRAIGEGRGKGKKYKKMMHMMMMGLMGKMALMGPLMMLMIKVKAIKALLLSKLALLMSLAQLLKGKKSGGGGSGKEVIIVHDNHGGGGGGAAEYGAGTAAGWVSGHTATGWSTGGGADSYSAGSHIGGGDNTYAGGQDSYSSGAGMPSGWAGVNGHGGSGWARKSMVHEPHWVAYRAYIPTPEDDHANEK
ncbi:uncharacterized protein LOC100159162 [Acyrthosiphon pisum]|uniref:Uncharacterized protein n=1 Tax=Acyrthosiphon pisum TaxID=7029 RepID=A0A8R1W2U7_ACYPI|nr:uncharacterized protein LOC100159162 [Acyrthosiphon pisum]|eukprot:XP_001947182.2 PREDICTED: uncharacterized protein LOC100159162 [Acyrthosiphon pisum]